MVDEMRNEVCIRIDNKLQALPPIFSDHTLHRVPRYLYEVNPKAYEPRIITIGLYHHGKPHLKMMEEHKVRFLSMLLRRTNETTVERYVALMQRMLEKVRNCYAESISMSDENFSEMLVLDGCFIVELLHQLLPEKNTEEYLMKHEIIKLGISQDITLFENQLPFFLLLELFGMTGELYTTKEYVGGLFCFFKARFQGLRDENVSIENVNHLLDCVVRNWLPSEELMDDYSQAPKGGEWLFIRSATELREAGIRFKKGKGESLFDIKFTDGVLEMPTILIYDETESLYRNVIVCEEFGNQKPKYFVDFMIVIDCLINTGKDVELLCRCGIIENGMGNDEVVVMG